MRIVGAEVLEYVRPLDGRSWNPLSRWTERRAPLLLLHADNGLTGCGEAWSRQERIGLVLDALASHVAQSIVGRNFNDAHAIRALASQQGADNWIDGAVASAADMALWSLLAKTHGVSLWKALGGARRSVAVYASGGLYRDNAGIDALVDEISAYRALGFRDIKIKVGGLPVAEDSQRIAAVRAAMGSADELWIDAVNQLQPATALDAASAFRSAGASAMQAPVAFDDYATMAEINRAYLPVIAGEAEYSMAAFGKLLSTHSVGLLQLNLGLCGGFSGAERIAALALEHSVPVTVQAHGTAILLGASLQWGAAAVVHSVEYHRFHNHLAFTLGASMLNVNEGQVLLDDREASRDNVRMGEQADGGHVRLHRSAVG